MRATVDGDTWSADRGANLLAEINSAGDLTIVGVHRATTTSISIGVVAIAGADSYPLGPIPGSSAVYIEPGPPGLSYSFVTTATRTGYLRLTLVDTAAHRLEGTFAFGAEGPDSLQRTIAGGELAVTYQDRP
jgi:hypothetical protein